MKDNQSEQGMGEQIMDALSDALQGGNFNELNRLVSQSVTNVLNEVGKHIPYIDCSEAQRQAQQSGAQTHDHTGEQARQAQEQARRQAEEQARQAQEQARRQAEEQTRQAQEQARRQTQGQAFRQAQEQARGRMRNQTRHQEKAFRQEKARRQARQMYQNENPAQWQTAPAAPPQLNNTALLPFHFKKVGSVSNVLYQVFGGIGLGFTLIFTLFHLIHVAVEGTASLAGWGINFLFLAIFADMIRLGIGQRKRLKLAERYAGLCGRNLYSEIEYLARSTGRKTRRVIKDLQKMMKIGMFPEGHLDEKRTCFMLSDGIYQQYLETENNRRMREAESRQQEILQNAQDLPKQDAGQESELPEQEAELNAMIAEGMECIRKLRDLNDKIAGEVISAKLSRLEQLLKDLFDSVREHPEQMHRMHKLMRYYLPTTLKLVEAYEEFDRISVPGDDILAAKAEIENTLDTINQAFSELLNNLFQDAVLDATTDAQVLKTMLAREGLMNEMDFAAADSNTK